MKKPAHGAMQRHSGYLEALRRVTAQGVGTAVYMTGLHGGGSARAGKHGLAADGVQQRLATTGVNAQQLHRRGTSLMEGRRGGGVMARQLNGLASRLNLEDRVMVLHDGLVEDNVFKFFAMNAHIRSFAAVGGGLGGSREAVNLVKGLLGISELLRRSSQALRRLLVQELASLLPRIKVLMPIGGSSKATPSHPHRRIGCPLSLDLLYVFVGAVCSEVVGGNARFVDGRHFSLLTLTTNTLCLWWVVTGGVKKSPALVLVITENVIDKAIYGVGQKANEHEGGYGGGHGSTLLRRLVGGLALGLAHSTVQLAKGLAKFPRQGLLGPITKLADRALRNSGAFGDLTLREPSYGEFCDRRLPVHDTHYRDHDPYAQS